MFYCLLYMIIMIYKSTRHLVIMGNHIQLYRRMLVNINNQAINNMHRLNQLHEINNIHTLNRLNRNNFISNFYNLN